MLSISRTFKQIPFSITHQPCALRRITPHLVVPLFPNAPKTISGRPVTRLTMLQARSDGQNQGLVDTKSDTFSWTWTKYAKVQA